MEQLLINLPKIMANLIVFTSIIVTTLYILFKIPTFTDFLVAKKQKMLWKAIVTIFLCFLIMAASHYALFLVAGGARVNIRDSIAILAAIIAGPISGIIVGLTGGIYRILLGGWTAIPCGLATITISIIASYLAQYKGYRIRVLNLRQIRNISIIAGIWEIIHTLIYVPLLGSKPVHEAFILMVQRAVIPMTITNMLGLATFLFICTDSVMRRKSQEEREEYSSMLEEEVRDRTEELNNKVEELRESQEKYKAIVDNSTARIVVCSADYRILFLNNEWLKHLNYRPGLPCYKVIAGLNEPCPTCRNDEVIGRGKTIHFDEELSDGAIFSVCNVPMKDASGNFYAKMSIAYDITERKHAEEALADERESLSVTLRSIGDGVIVVDKEGKITLFNNIAEKLTGWEQKQAVGKPLMDVFRIIGGEAKSCCEDPLEKVLETGNIVNLSTNTFLLSADGKRKALAGSTAPIRDRKSNIIGLVLVFRDITDRKRIEEDLQNAEKLESIGILAGGIAHDFNNILAAILGNISIAKIHAKPGDNFFERLEEAEKASMRAKDLTQQLLTFSKGGDPIKKAAPISEVVKDTTSFILSGSNVGCEFHMPEDVWTVDVDKGQISQVIHNLVINATQAMPEGGRIFIAAENKKVDGNTDLPLSPGDYVEISIRDKGIGIRKEHLSKIFDPYFSTKQKGSGLGLASAYSIVKRHDGYLGVESEIGVGTTFYIYLHASQKKFEKRKETNTSISSGHGRILLMDDEDIVLKVGGEMLKTLGYDVKFAKDGDEAIKIYKNHKEEGTPFDVVIMDLTIAGGMGGKETIKILKEAEPGVKAIVSSGYSTDPIMANYKEYGFMGVIAKPYKITEIGEVINRVLSL